MMTPAPRFNNDDEAAQHWLTLLREGDPAQKVQAREQLAAIFERRGMFEEAVDLLASNIRDGVRNADVFRWLARLYRAQGDEVTAMQAAAEAAKYMPPVATPLEPAPATRPMTQTLPSMPVQEPAMPAPVPVAGPPGACPECGYVNRNVRSTCARCHTPLSAGAMAGMPSGVQPREGMSPTTTGGEPRPWYLSTAAIILASSLCIPPLALAFVWMRPWRETVKYAASAPLLIWSILWVIGVGGAMVRSSSPPSNSVASTASTSSAAQQPAVAPPVSKSEPTPRPPTAAPAPPTATPLPPTPTPRPISLKGKGRTATDQVTPPSGISTVSFTHDGGRNFIVKAIHGKSDLLVNTIGPYQGQRLLAGDQPVMFDIEADGAWTVEMVPIRAGVEPSFAGRGDKVSPAFDPPSNGPWVISHDGKHNFIVHLHCAGGSTLVENTIGSVDESAVVTFKRGPCLWEVEADGNWRLAPR